MMLIGRELLHSLVLLPNTSELVSLCGRWGSKCLKRMWYHPVDVQTTTGFNLMGDWSKRKHNSLQRYYFSLVLLCIIIVQRKILFKIYLMHSCSCNTQVLSGCYLTDWLEKCQQQKTCYHWYCNIFKCLFILIADPCYYHQNLSEPIERAVTLHRDLTCTTWPLN